MELFKTTGVLDEMVLKEVAKKGILKSEKEQQFLVSCSASYSVLQDILRLQLFSFLRFISCIMAALSI